MSFNNVDQGTCYDQELTGSYAADTTYASVDCNNFALLGLFI